MANNYVETENNEMEIDGFKALIAANPDTNVFRVNSSTAMAAHISTALM